MAWSFFKKILFCIFILSLCIPKLDEGNDESVASRVGQKTSTSTNPDRLVVHIVTSNPIIEEAKTVDIVYNILKKSLEQPRSSDGTCKNKKPKILTVTIERPIFIFDPAMQKVTGIARYRQRI